MLEEGDHYLTLTATDVDSSDTATQTITLSVTPPDHCIYSVDFLSPTDSINYVVGTVAQEVLDSVSYTYFETPCSLVATFTMETDGGTPVPSFIQFTDTDPPSVILDSSLSAHEGSYSLILRAARPLESPETS